MSYRGFLGQIRPEVEKPTGKTTVWRPLLLVFLLVIIAVVSTIIAALWLVNASRIVDPLFVGPALVGVVLIVAAESITFHPFAIRWKRDTNQKQAVSVLLIGVLASLLYLTGNWPAQNHEYHTLLFWTWQLAPAVEGGGLWARLNKLAMVEIISGQAILWTRIIAAIALPIALPYAVRLIWYRYGVELVYPSWPDGAIPRGLRWLDPTGLLDIRLPSESEAPDPIMPSARTDDEGAI